MRINDYIIAYLTKKGVNTIFMVAGGQAMFLNDAVYRTKQIRPICTHHEQAAGMAAEAYGRISGKLGVVMVTAGPAAVNVLNGVVGAWTDSSPMLVISGQSALPNVKYMEKTGIRQFGLQGIYIRPLAEAVTKYFATVEDPANIAYHMEKAYYLATTGRVGPVWLEVPLDVQRMEVPTKLIKHFDPPMIAPQQNIIKKQVTETLAFLYKSQRPLLLVGQGVRLAKADGTLSKLLNKINIPVITTRLGIDLIPSDHPSFVGRPGLYGDRAANFAVQLADFILAVGARLDPGIIGYDAADWGRQAQKVIVDIDPKELEKPGIQNALRFQTDAQAFLTALLTNVKVKKMTSTKKWLTICHQLKNQYPTVAPAYKNEHPVNSYYLSERLSYWAKPNEVIVVDTSSPFHVVCQAWSIKKGQRFITTGGISTMGYWAAAIGACLAGQRQGRRNRGQRTIVVTGDGCLQMNLQELATVKHNQLPIKLFVINNNGYLLIRHTQKTHMEGRLIGESPKTGLWCPDSIAIAKAYGIKAVKIKSAKNIDKKIREVLDYKGPVVCDVDSPQWQPIIPRVSSEKKPDGTLVSKPYEDMYPFLDKKELAAIKSLYENSTCPISS